MLLINRTTPTLTTEEHDLSALTPIPPRTTPRPTNQWSGELRGSALEEFSRPTLDTEDADIEFAPVPDDPPPADTPRTASPPASEFTLHGAQIPRQLLQGGTWHVRLNLTDLALLALVFRHATDNLHLHRLNPLMSSTLESLAATFESLTLLALQQAGQVHPGPNSTLHAEQVQAWCQRIVVEGVSERVPPAYDAGTPMSTPEQAPRHSAATEET